jgi:hypothetical protein
MEKMLKTVLLALTASVLWACATLDYRSVQDDFNEAVQLDTGIYSSELGDTRNAISLGQPITAGYDRVVTALTEDYIGKLDPRLQPNAYILRAFSYWRLGDYEAALNASDRVSTSGGTRDHLLSIALKGMIAEGERWDQFKANDDKVCADSAASCDPANAYDEFAADYVTSLSKLDKARDARTALTPQSILHYIALQRWRIIAHWRYITLSLDNYDSELARRKLKEAKAALGDIGFKDAMTEAAKQIPDSSPLMQIINVCSAGAC